MRGIIELLDYHEVVKVDKIRTKTRYNDMEICLDEVQNLGSFIEVEKIVTGDGDVVQEELFTFLESIEIKREDRVFSGYDTLMYVKGGNI
jgi:adenylate cyclase class 2